MKLRRISAMLAALCVPFAVQTASAEKIIVGSECTYPPFEYVNDGKIEGYDIDIMNAIGKEAGFEPEFHNMPFDSILPAIMTNQIDVGASGFDITEERKKKVDFAGPYHFPYISVVIREADKDKLKTKDDLKDKRLCVQIGTTGAEAAEKLTKDIGYFNASPDAFMELRTGGCVGVINDHATNQYFLKNGGKDGGYLEMPGVSPGAHAEGVRIMVNKSNTALRDRIQAGLQKIKENGEYRKLRDKWFADGATAK